MSRPRCRFTARSTPHVRLVLTLAAALALTVSAVSSAAASGVHRSRHHGAVHRHHHKRRTRVTTSSSWLTVTSEPANPTSSTSAHFAWTTTQPSTPYCKLDGGSWVKCPNPTTNYGSSKDYANLTPGTHTFQLITYFQSSSATASYTWTVSSTSGSSGSTSSSALTITSEPSNPTSSTSAHFAWTTAQPSTPYCKLDGGSWVKCPNPTTNYGSSYDYANLAAGTHTFQVIAYFQSSSATASYTWTVSPTSTTTTSTTTTTTTTTPTTTTPTTTTPTTTTPTSTPTPTGSAPACTIYVSPSGSSGASGSSSSSPTTLASAVSSVSPGSVVCLEPGTYTTSSNIYLSRSGTSSAPITFRNDGGTARIQYTGGTANGGLLQVTSGSNWSGAHNIVIDGLTLDGANAIGGGVFVTNGAHNVTVENCVITNMGATGIAFNATDYVTARGNLIYHNGYNQGWSSGISLWYGGGGATYGGSTAWYDTAPGFHNVIVDNIISGQFDASSAKTDGNGIIVDGSGSIPPALIADNLTYENGGRGIEDNANSGDVFVVNNTAYADGLDLSDSGGQAPDFQAINSSNAHFTNDLAYGRQNGSTYTNAYLYNNTSSSVSWLKDWGFNGTTAGVSASTFTMANPQFTSVPALASGSSPWANALAPWNVGNDFTLAPGSPAIGAGSAPTTGMTSAEATSAQPYLSTDLGGQPYGSSIDIGAYQS